jgi:hypothetical protein
MADLELELADVKRYRADANEAAVAGIVKHLGIALLNPQADSALVSATDDSELLRVKESWLERKLGLSGDDELNAAIGAIAAVMKEDKRKRRVTFYYLLAEHFDKLDALV